MAATRPHARQDRQPPTAEPRPGCAGADPETECTTVETTRMDEPAGEEPRGILRHIADADRLARAGKPEEPVRNTPPAGPWNETTHD